MSPPPPATRGATKPPSATSAMDPRRLNKFLDSPSNGNGARVQHAAEIKGHTKELSWNGEKCDTRAFESRLAVPDHVVLMGDRRAPRLLTQQDQAIPASGLMVSKNVPIQNNNSALYSDATIVTAPLLVQRDGFGHGPEIAHVHVPKSVLLYEQGLLTPAQRRERLQFETKYHGARRAMEQAERDERRLHQIVNGRHVTNDIMNTEPIAQRGASAVRGEPFNAQLLSHSNAANGGLPREYQKKTNKATPHLHTHDRIFNETPVSWSAERAQYLRNEGQAGRPFDIVNGGVVQYFPPTIHEKQHERQSHPSVITHPYTR